MSEDIKKDEVLGEEAEAAAEAVNEAAEEAAAVADEAAEEAVAVADEAVKEAEAVADGAAEEAAAADEALSEELETLRDTFQEKYNETVEEAVNGPVIQELESHTGDPEEENEEPDEVAASDAPVKKKKRTGLKVFIIIVVILAVLVFGLLIAYFVLSVSNPNFNSLVSSLASAQSAETYEEKMDAYEQALSYCDGESSSQQAMKEVVVDKMLKAAYQEEGFNAAFTMMNQYMTEEQIASSKSKTVKTIKTVIAAADEIADGSLDAVFAALAENPEATAEDVAKTFSVPSEVNDSVVSALGDEIKAVALLKESAKITSVTEAIQSLQSAYSVFTGAGADKQDLAEKMAVSLYKNKYPFAAMTMANSFLDDEAEPINQEFKDMKDDVGDFSGVDVSVYGLAAKAESGGRTDYAAFVAENCKASEAQASMLGDLVGFCVDGIAAEKGKNYSQAATAFASTHSVVDALGITDNKLIVRMVYAMIESGDLSQLQSYDALLTDDLIAGLSAKDAAQMERAKQINSALKASSEVFGNYYMNYMYGQAIDYKAACDDLDALITEKSNNYDKGFVAYCKYYAAIYTNNKADLEKYVNEMKAAMPDLKAIYGYSEIELFKEAGKYDEAQAVAASILEANIGDDYANATLAFVKRTKGDVAGALKTAVKGIELSGVESFCADEAMIDYMLTGDFESAFPYLKSAYQQNSQSPRPYDMVLIFNALYKGADKTVKEEVAAMADEVAQMYQSYQMSTYFPDAAAIISGEKTLEDVFCAGRYDLLADDATVDAEVEESAEAALESTTAAPESTTAAPEDTTAAAAGTTAATE